MIKKISIIIISVLLVFSGTTLMVFAGPMDSGMDTYHGEMPELQNAIAKQAIACAWPPGTPKSKYKYNGGSPTAAYRSALSKAYGSRSSWGKQTRAGASCDVFVGTVARSCGYDPNFPRGLEQDIHYLPSSSKFSKVSISSLSDYEPGDIIFMIYRGGGGHICIYVEVGGTGYFANAHYAMHAYGCMDSKAKVLRPSKFKRFGVYRATGECVASYSEGDQSEDVKKIQKFLKWAGYFKGSADGIYGESTTKAVMKYQKEIGAEETGTFDKTCFQNAKIYSNNQAGGTAVK